MLQLASLHQERTQFQGTSYQCDADSNRFYQSTSLQHLHPSLRYLREHQELTLLLGQGPCLTYHNLLHEDRQNPSCPYTILGSVLQHHQCLRTRNY